MRIRIGPCVAVAAILAAPIATVAAGENLDTLAERLVELRGKVEGLQDDIETRQTAHRARMSALASRRSGLESELRAKELQLRQLQQATAKQREEVRAQTLADEELAPLAEELAAAVQNLLSESLPFQREARLEAVESVQKDLAAGKSSAAQSVEKLWSLLEDELRLSRENGVTRQEISVEGQSYLADVIHLGTVMAFFQTTDGTSGFAKRENGAWTFHRADRGDAELIDALFLSFERQVRTGVFELPNPLTHEVL